jgi:glycosyltransferase involved in cell wall biosynthesis
MRVAYFPRADANTSTPYFLLLQRHLEERGVEFDVSNRNHLESAWLIRQRGKVDALHLHFPHFQYTTGHQRASVRLAAALTSKLLMARSLGYNIVWTVHNLFPHERPDPYLVDYLARLALAQLATNVIVHCQHGHDTLCKTFRRHRNVHVIKHAAYVGFYPDTISRQQARLLLGLSLDQRVFLFVGNLRVYKGLDSLIEAFRQIPNTKATLIIAGKPWTALVETHLLNMAQGDNRIVVHPTYVPDSELQNYFKAADVAVLPYNRILSSGSVLLAMSFGCPVIVPALGCIPEIVPSDAGILYDTSDHDGLLGALQVSMAADTEAMGHRAYEHAMRLTFAEMAERTLMVYHLNG